LGARRRHIDAANVLAGVMVVVVVITF
jgi:hypothetical protein